MSRHILRTHNKKRVIIDMTTDPKLYSAPKDAPNANTQHFTTGIDLFVHTSRSRNVYFYFFNWSWCGDDDKFEIIDIDTAEKFLVEKSGVYGWAGIEFERAKAFEIDLMKETG